MAAGLLRDDAELIAGFERWLASRDDDFAGLRVVGLRRPSAGWTNETVMLEVGEPSATLVVRMPSLVPSFPRYPLDEQGEVIRVLRDAGVRVPEIVDVVHDVSYVGTPFVVMACVAGRALGEVPALDPWLLERPEAEQRSVHDSFLRALADVHRVPWASTTLVAHLRIGLDAELDYWMRYIDWAADGAPTPRLVDAWEWCTRTAPPPNGAHDALLWGDARLGNVMYDERAEISALLDWELATIGPPEMDLGWYLGLDALTTHFVRRTVPGFLDRDAAVASYERALGRPVEHLDWHEVFALVRSIAVNECQARLAAKAGTRYPGVAGDDNPVLDYVWERITNSPAVP